MWEATDLEKKKQKSAVKYAQINTTQQTHATKAIPRFYRLHIHLRNDLCCVGVDDKLYSLTLTATSFW